MDRQVEKKTLDNTVVLDSKLEKAVSFNTTLNAEEVFEQLGGHIGGVDKVAYFYIQRVMYIRCHLHRTAFSGYCFSW